MLDIQIKSYLWGRHYEPIQINWLTDFTNSLNQDKQSCYVSKEHIEFHKFKRFPHFQVPNVAIFDIKNNAAVTHKLSYK